MLSDIEREPNWKPGNRQNLTDEARQKAREAKENRHAYHFLVQEARHLARRMF